MADCFDLLRTLVAWTHHATTLLLCVVLMWLVFNWREAVASTKILKTMLDMSNGWKDAMLKDSEYDYELRKDLFDGLDKVHSELDKVFREVMEEKGENHNLRLEYCELAKELHEARKALWIEKNGPQGDDDVFF